MFWYQGRHGRFLAGKTTTVAATSLECRRCLSAVSAVFYFAKSRPWSYLSYLSYFHTWKRRRIKFRMLLQNYIQLNVCCLSKYWLRNSVCIMILLCVFEPKTSSYSTAALYFYCRNSSENPWAKLKINIRNMWKKGCDHDVVLLIFGTRFLAQTATEKHPNKHSVQNKCLKI